VDALVGCFVDRVTKRRSTTTDDQPCQVASGGPLQDRTVNVKWYLKQEGLLDITEALILDYLVMTGPRSAATSSRKSTRPWQIDSVYLFRAVEL
jgi:hypothetical protein